MIGFKRWIALGPTAVLLLAGLPGCKIGAKLFSCHQTSCMATPCGDTGKAGCASTSGCQCRAKGKSCLCASGKANGCLSACAATSQSKTSCASMGCATTGKVSCNTACVMIPQRTAQHQTKPAYESAPGPEASLLQLEPVIVPQQIPVSNQIKPINPEARQEEETKAFPFPVPEPVSETETARPIGNPFLKVSQTQEGRASTEVSAAHVPSVNPYAEWEHNSEEPHFAEHNFSQPWADALGLPSAPPEPVQAYRRGR